MIYADANVVIRLIEGDAATRAPLEARLLPLRGTGRFLLTSRLTRLECRVKPLRAGDAALLTLYDAFFAGAEVELLDITAAVVEGDRTSGRTQRENTGRPPPGDRHSREGHRVSFR